MRFLSWIWERLEFLPPYDRSSGEEMIARKLSSITNTLREDALLATSVKYFYALLRPRIDADSCPLKVHDSGPHVG